MAKSNLILHKDIDVDFKILLDNDDDSKEKYKTHEDALRAFNSIRNATGGKIIYPEGKLITFGLWENTDAYKNGVKVEKPKPKDENDHPF